MSRRNRSITRVRWALAFVAVASVGIVAASTLWDERSAEYRRGFSQGRAEADAQFAAGVVTMYTLGLPVDDSNIDGATGLPLQPIAGCLVDDAILGRAEGHNRRVLELLDAGKPAANSRKTWIDDLNDLARHYTRQGRGAEGSKPVRLAVDGPSVVCPEGRRKVRLDRPTAELPQFHRLVVIQPDDTPRYADGLVRRAETELRWGPPGSNFCVIHDRAAGTYDAVDLVTARTLRTTTRVRKPVSAADY